MATVAVGDVQAYSVQSVQVWDGGRWSPSGGAGMFNAPTYAEFYSAVLGRMRIIPTSGNLRAFGAITLFEGRSPRFNPMNWVIPYGPSTQYNSTGVQDYRTWFNGVDATAYALLTSTAFAPFTALLPAATSRDPLLAAASAVYQAWDKGADIGKTISWTAGRDVLLEVMPS